MLKKKFQEKLDKIKEQEGGDKKRKKSKKSSEKSDSDSDDLYIRSKRNYFSDPLVYRLDKLYLSTFYSYITPYIHLDSTIVAKTITTRPSNTKTVIFIDP